MILTVVLGRLTRDPVVRATKSGKTFCSFTVAADYRAKDKDGNKLTGFFDCTAWEQLGELCGKYLSKGRQVLVTGEVGIDTYTTQAGENRSKLTLKADKVEFIGSKSEAAENAEKRPENAYQDVTESIQEELPF